MSPFTGEIPARQELTLLRQANTHLSAQVERLTRDELKTDREWVRLEAQLYLAERGLRNAALSGNQPAARALEEIEAVA
jgi:hypothetical protein